MATPRRLRLFAGLFVVALLAAACSSDNKTNTSSGSGSGGGGNATQVSLAYVGPLTGDAANLGVNIRNGAKTAIDEYNKKGGKVKVTLKEFDTKGDPAQATTVKDSYINDKSIIGIIGPAFSGETKAVIPALDEAGLVMVSASATNTQLPTVVPNTKVFHRVIADDSFQGKGIGDYIIDTLKGKSIVVVDDNSEYGKGLADDTSKEIQAKGQTVGKRLSVDPKSQDFSAAVNDAKAANPDVVMYAGYYQEAGRLKKQLADGGVSATFISGDGSLDPGFVAAAGGSAAEGALLSCPCNLAVESSPGTLGDFYKSYKADNSAEPGTYSPEAFDVANIFLKGIDAGKTDRASMLAFVNSLGTYTGVSKTIEFEANGNIKTPQLYVFVVKNGKLAPKT
jgi:branched-chain amino acid transport system substrate-binding protein